MSDYKKIAEEARARGEEIKKSDRQRRKRILSVCSSALCFAVILGVGISVLPGVFSKGQNSIDGELNSNPFISAGSGPNFYGPSTGIPDWMDENYYPTTGTGEKGTAPSYPSPPAFQSPPPEGNTPHVDDPSGSHGDEWTVPAEGPSFDFTGERPDAVSSDLCEQFNDYTTIPFKLGKELATIDPQGLYVEKGRTSISFCEQRYLSGGNMSGSLEEYARHHEAVVYTASYVAFHPSHPLFVTGICITDTEVEFFRGCTLKNSIEEIVAAIKSTRYSENYEFIMVADENGERLEVKTPAVTLTVEKPANGLACLTVNGVF